MIDDRADFSNSAAKTRRVAGAGVLVAIIGGLVLLWLGQAYWRANLRVGELQRAVDRGALANDPDDAVVAPVGALIDDLRIKDQDGQVLVTFDVINKSAETFVGFVYAVARFVGPDGSVALVPSHPEIDPTLAESAEGLGESVKARRWAAKALMIPRPVGFDGVTPALTVYLKAANGQYATFPPSLSH